MNTLQNESILLLILFGIIFGIIFGYLAGNRFPLTSTIIDLVNCPGIKGLLNKAQVEKLVKEAEKKGYAKSRSLITGEWVCDAGFNNGYLQFTRRNGLINDQITIDLGKNGVDTGEGIYISLMDNFPENLENRTPIKLTIAVKNEKYWNFRNLI